MDIFKDLFFSVSRGWQQYCFLSINPVTLFQLKNIFMITLIIIHQPTDWPGLNIQTN